jgi:signal transduction histidine kinase
MQMATTTRLHERDRLTDRWQHRDGLSQRTIALHKSKEGESRAAEEDIRRVNRELEQQLAERTREVQQRVAQIQRMAVEMTCCEQRERTRLAHVLHDELQQLLVAARMNVALLRRGGNDEQLSRTIGQLDDLLSQAIAESRSLAVELSPPMLYRDGLAQALKWLAQEMAQRHGLTASVQVEADAEPASETLRAFLFQAVRELLFNVAKHAQADRAHVKMAKAGERLLRIEVSDNGVGFEPGNQKAGAEGFGLASIQQRLHFLGGYLEIDSAPDKGTRMVMLAPLHDPGDAACRPGRKRGITNV